MRLDLVNFRGTVPIGAGTSLLAEWRVGTILQAVAIRDAKTGQLWLDLGAQRHPARIASGDQEGPAHGERLNVRVLRTHPVLALETLSSTDAADEAQIAAEALRRFVPKQESPTMMRANRAWLLQGKNGAASLPKGVLEAAQRLWSSLPDAQSLQDPDGLAEALNRSGAFLEAKLASAHKGANEATFASDLKALMLSLSRAIHESGGRARAARSDTAGHAPVPTQQGPLASLPSAPATFSLIDTPAQQLHELARQTEGALARLTTLQLANNAGEPGAQSILIELPVRHEDRTSMLRLRIEQDEQRRGEHEGSGAWSVEAALDLGSV